MTTTKNLIVHPHQITMLVILISSSSSVAFCKYRHFSYNTVLLYRGILSNVVFIKTKNGLTLNAMNVKRHSSFQNPLAFLFFNEIKVSQSRNGFLVFRFPLKNERKPFDFLQKTIFVRFFEEIADIKKPF